MQRALENNALSFTITALHPRDRAAWARLFRGHLQACGDAESMRCVDLTWAWLREPDPQIWALLAWADSGRAVGVVHYQRMLRTRQASGCAYMSDLFVDPEWRGRGIARELVTAVAQAARRHGWRSMRWLTDPDNAAGRAVYADFGAPASDIVYDIAMD